MKAGPTPTSWFARATRTSLPPPRPPSRTCWRACGAARARPREARLNARGQSMAEPQSLPEKAFPVSWDQFHRDARALAWRLAAAGPFTAIVAITRGGLVPAAIVARELNVRLIETVCVESYHDYTKQGELRVIKPVSPEIL